MKGSGGTVGISQVDKLQALHEIGRAITSQFDLDLLLPMIVDAASTIINCEETTLYLVDTTNEVLYARAQKTETSELPKLLKLRTSDSLIADVFRSGEPVRLAGEEIRIVTGLLGTAILAVPLGTFGERLGVLAAYNWKKGHEFDESDEYFFSAVSAYAAIAIRNSRMMREKDKLVMTDSLTQLSSRRAFDDALPFEVARAQRYGSTIGLIVLDVDCFKDYNDDLGHPAGDERLRQLGRTIRSQIRQSDRAFRIGGDEFAVLLPHVNDGNLMKAAERLRQKLVEAAPLSPPKGIPVSGYTVSMGTSVLSDGVDNAEDFFFRADQALLRAKRMGGNIVMNFSTQTAEREGAK